MRYARPSEKPITSQRIGLAPSGRTSQWSPTAAGNEQVNRPVAPRSFPVVRYKSQRSMARVRSSNFRLSMSQAPQQFAANVGQLRDQLGKDVRFATLGPAIAPAERGVG